MKMSRRDFIKNSGVVAGTAAGILAATGTITGFISTKDAQAPDCKVNIPGYAKASLPALNTPGCLVRVTDEVRGVWMNQGSDLNLRIEYC
jgi:anaerobic selenocysteine-containing dehydrogenase